MVLISDLQEKLMGKTLYIVFVVFLPVRTQDLVTDHPLKVSRNEIKSALVDHKIIPDALDEAPAKGILFEWVHGPKAMYGNIMEPIDVLLEPYWVKWDFEIGAHYTIMMFGLDEPSRHNHTLREWQFWLVGNVPEYSIRFGDILYYYLGPKPPKGSGKHRYVVLLYLQPNGTKINFDEKKKPIYDIRDDKIRGKFSHRQFSQKYGLGKPIACNFFQCKWAPAQKDNDTFVS